MDTKEVWDLEPQQYKRLYWEEDVPLNDVRKSTLRRFVYLGSSLCLLFISLGFFVKFPDQIEMSFIIKSNQTEQVYRFAQPVYVIEKYIKPKDVVIKGQQLVRITSPEIVDLINNFRDAEQKLQNFSSRKSLSIESEKEMIKNRIRQNEAGINEVRKELEVLVNKYKSNLAAAEYEKEATSNRYDVMKKLYDEKATSKFELMEYEAKKNKAVDDLENAKQNYEKAKYNLVTLRSRYFIDNRSSTEELEKIGHDVRHDSAYLKSQYLLAKGKIENIFGNCEVAGGDLILKAGNDGIVSYIFDGEKEVSTGVILMKMINNLSDFYASVQSPPSKIGRLKTGKHVVLKVASFPFYEWGTIKGQIENLSITPDELGNYPVKISIVNYGKLKALMQPGMNGDATIILEERTIYYYFFHHIKKTYYNTIK